MYNWTRFINPPSSVGIVPVMSFTSIGSNEDMRIRYHERFRKLEAAVVVPINITHRNPGLLASSIVLALLVCSRTIDYQLEEESRYVYRMSYENITNQEHQSESINNMNKLTYKIPLS
jgi:ADP-ribosylglycohydrolase